GQLFQELGLEKYELQLNSLGARECRNRYRDALKKFLEGVSGDWDKDVKERIQRNPLRVLDSKDETVQKALSEAPNILDFLSDESKAHFEEVQRALEEIKIPFVVNPRIVRGLDYYEKTVFEFISDELGAQNTVAAGGRYNDLVKDLGGPAIPAVGFALGMERLTSLLHKEKLAGDELPRVYLIGLDEQADRELFPQIQGIREAGARVQLDLGGSSLKSKMRRAAKWEADWVIIAGPEERARGVVVFRDMAVGSQEEIPSDQIFSQLFSKFPTQTFIR
ncbi:MAG: ATP phosphoribosyltransferase regulatory subunit, partial [bacterium]|nr:ATP phosphoribosyltransferase regulatory subunit [bacterium]